MRHFPAARVIAALPTFLFLLVLAACSGGSSPQNTATQIVLSPTTASVNKGQVFALSAVAEDYQNNTVSADIGFTTSNDALVTISPGGAVCGGVWDANYINCNVVSGSAGIGQATITAYTGTNNHIKATIPVYVHEQVDRIAMNPPASCTSMNQAINLSAVAYNTTNPGCTVQKPCDITSTVGPFTFAADNLAVAAPAIDTGVLTAIAPGATSVYASVSGNNSVAVPYETCAIKSISIEGATSTVPTYTLASSATQVITASVFDTAGNNVTPVLTWSSTSSASVSLGGTGPTSVASVKVTAAGNGYTSSPTVNFSGGGGSGAAGTATVSGGTVSGVTITSGGSGYTEPPSVSFSGGGGSGATAQSSLTQTNTSTLVGSGIGYATISATCSNPSCNINLPPQYSQSIVTGLVTGASATTAYAASTNSVSLVPITTSTNAVGTTITLPYTPNSILAARDGATLYLGSASGLMVITVSGGTEATYSVSGQILAISNDGTYAIIADSNAGDTYVYDLSTKSIVSTSTFVATSAAFTPDNQTAVFFDGPTAYLASTTSATLTPTTLAVTPTALDMISSGALTYFTSSTGAGIDVRSTCNMADIETLPAAAPTLIAQLPAGTGAIAVDGSNLDLITTGALGQGCPTTANSTLASYPMSVSGFNVRQLLVSPDSSRAWIITDQPELLGLTISGTTPFSVGLANGATAYSGGFTADSATLYVGASDGNVHRISVASMSDAQQIAVGLKDTSGNATYPNLVAVIP